MPMTPWGESGVPQVMGDNGRLLGGVYGMDAANADSIRYRGQQMQMDDLMSRRIGGVPNTPGEWAVAQTRGQQSADAQRQDFMNRAMGLFGGAPGAGGVGGGSGSSSGTNAGGSAANKPLWTAYTNKLMQALQNPGMTQGDEERIINRGTDEIAERERAQGFGMEQRAAERGAGRGGAVDYARQQLGTQYGGQRANLARDVRIQGAMDRENRTAQNIGMAGDYLGRVADRESSDRNSLAGLLMQQANGVQAPNYSAGISQGPGASIGAYGGGANKGGNTTTVSGGGWGGGTNSTPGGGSYGVWNFKDAVSLGREKP